jgi:hypothetical protein
MIPNVPVMSRGTPRQMIDWTKVFEGQPLWFLEVKK